jgi:hypothetical protein
MQMASSYFGFILAPETLSSHLKLAKFLLWCVRILLLLYSTIQIRSKSSWRWCINTLTDFLDFIHQPLFKTTFCLELLGFWILSIVQNVSKTGFMSSGEGGKTPTQLGPLEWANLNDWTGLPLSKGPNWVGIFPPPPHLRMETDPVSETLCFLVSRIPDDGQSPILNIIHHRQNPLEPTFSFRIKN